MITIKVIIIGHRGKRKLLLKGMKGNYIWAKQNVGSKNYFESKKMSQSGVGSMQGSSKGRLPLKVVFHCWSFSTTGRLTNLIQLI